MRARAEQLGVALVPDSSDGWGPVSPRSVFSISSLSSLVAESQGPGVSHSHYRDGVVGDDLTPVPLCPEDLAEFEPGREPRARDGEGSPRDLSLLLTEVMVQHGRRLFEVAARYAGRDEAWDCVQAAVATALERPGAFVHDDSRRLAGWLETATRHEALHLLRRRRRSSPVAPEDLEEWGSSDLAADPDAAVMLRDDRLVALEALASLHPHERACIAAVACGHKRPEVADRLNLSERTVARRLLEGRKALGHFADRYVSEERCRELRPELSDYADGALESGPARDGLQLHLRHCVGCRGQVAQLRRERVALGAAFPPVLVLPGAFEGGEVVSAESAVRTGDDAPERSVALLAGFLARVGAGWDVLWSGLGPLGRLAGASVASIALLFGIGSVWGNPSSDSPSAPVSVAAESGRADSPTPARTADTKEATEVARGPRAADLKRTVRRKPVTAKSDPGSSRAASAAASAGPVATTVAASRGVETSPSRPGPSNSSWSGPSVEFEPGPWLGS
jgi:RNA polymerase sigma factor (sigma-70 family)